MIFSCFIIIIIIIINPLTERVVGAPQMILAWRGMGSARLYFAQDSPCDDNTQPDRSPPESTRTAPSSVHQDRGVKCATGEAAKIHGRDNITRGTWNTRTLRDAGKLQELVHEMNGYRWNILGLCEMR